ncbi:unnamed protein product [Hymenolepis diminuta]|uniref:Protein kinase domain-containing protein n=1 Tax=Hymenolepis diminuta TaxID=6216 RepID=A0A0R3SUP3_HYMDI|nr:unnamed protein product [Hymenolepis diminuta]VUZ48208.1 unnamed protein product [Hymenolepis diminuta]
MRIEDFQIVRVIGAGKHTIIYEVVHTHDRNKSARYAMKRYFLSETTSIHRALQERKILQRLITSSEPSPFVSSFFWAIGGWKTPCVITTLGSTYNLFDLRKSQCVLTEEDACFYICEIMCGLEYIHQMEIVHRDIKLENILLSETGHVIIADFDLAYDLRGHGRGLNSALVVGTYEYMAPEIANSGPVTTKADIFSLGALSAHLVTLEFRPNAVSKSRRIHMAKVGFYDKENITPLSRAMRNFLNTCLHPNYLERPEVLELKSMQYFNSIDWMEVAACRRKPPFQISQIHYSNFDNFIIDPTNEVLINAAFGQNKPIIEGHQKLSDISKLDVVPVNLIELELNGYTDERIKRKFKSFDFVNPFLLELESKNEQTQQ